MHEVVDKVPTEGKLIARDGFNAHVRTSLNQVEVWEPLSDYSKGGEDKQSDSGRIVLVSPTALTPHSCAYRHKMIG